MSFRTHPFRRLRKLANELSNRAQEDARLLRLIRASFKASHGIYGAPRVFLDLREAGETCSKHRVSRLMRENGLKALHGCAWGLLDAFGAHLKGREDMGLTNVELGPIQFDIHTKSSE